MTQNAQVQSSLAVDYDVAVVGGGIVGTTLVAALRDSGLKVALIERAAESVAIALGRAYVISLLSGRIFQGLGIWDKVLPHITQFQKIALSDADHPNVVHFHPQDLDTPVLGYAAEHRVLLPALQAAIQDSPEITWLCPAEVQNVTYGDKVAELELLQNGEVQKIRTRLVVAADGAKSPLRTAAGISTKGWRYWQSCVIATIKIEKPHQNVAYERFWSAGPMGVLPLPGNRCQVVWTAPHEEAKALQELEVGEFLQKLEYHTGGLLGKLELMGDRHLFPVQLMQSDRYTLPRLALIGDAAHCCHPVTGQGMNLGIRDAAALAQVLKAAQEHQEDIGDLRVLQRYDRWRRTENWVILAITDFLDRMFSNNWWPAVVARRLGLWMLKLISPFKVFCLQLLTGLRGRSPNLAQH